MKLLSLGIVFIATLFSNCKDEVKNTEIVKIEFGTSFGMCAGYCTQILTVTRGNVAKVVIPRMDKNLQKKTCESSYSGYNALISELDVDAFMSLEETIGCPDCADGGAEWVEITTAEVSKKVTYEYGKTPDALLSIIDELKRQYNTLDECD
ncbi:hypothetical protein [Ekhidna sp.]|uniref:hypothetical protein n=1 Tax=Ekhidna sp. TaxID=2608089 RepID=UPI003298852A